MKVKQCDLKYIGTNFSHYPMDGKPEIAFAGKSNVGKSTLINAILGRKALKQEPALSPEKHAPSILWCE